MYVIGKDSDFRDYLVDVIKTHLKMKNSERTKRATFKLQANARLLSSECNEKKEIAKAIRETREIFATLRLPENGNFNAYLESILSRELVGLKESLIKEKNEALINKVDALLPLPTFALKYAAARLSRKAQKDWGEIPLQSLISIGIVLQIQTMMSFENIIILARKAVKENCRLGKANKMFFNELNRITRLAIRLGDKKKYIRKLEKIRDNHETNMKMYNEIIGLAEIHHSKKMAIAAYKDSEGSSLEAIRRAFYRIQREIRQDSKNLVT